MPVSNDVRTSQFEPTTRPTGRKRDAETNWAPTLPTAAFLVVAGILVVGQMYLALPLLGSMANDLDATRASLTNATTAFGFAYAVGFLLAGPLADRFGPRPMITGGLSLIAVATALVPLGTVAASVVALRAVQGFVCAALVPAAFSYIAQQVRPNHRAATLSWVTSSMLASAVVAQVLGQVLVDGIGWRGVFWSSAGCLVAAAVAAWLVVRPNLETHPHNSIANVLLAVPRLLSRPRLVALYVATMTVLGGFVAVYTAIALAAPPALDLDGQGRLIALRSSALPALIAIPILAPLLVRVSARTRIVGSLLVSALAAGLASAGQSSLTALVAALLIFVAGIGVAAPALVETVSAIAGAQRGTAAALYAFSMFAGGSIGSLLVATFASAGFVTISLGIAGVLVVGAIVAFASGINRRKHPSPSLSSELTHTN